MQGKQGMSAGGEVLLRGVRRGWSWLVRPPLAGASTQLVLGLSAPPIPPSSS